MVANMAELKDLELKGKRVLIRLDLNVSSRDPKKIENEDKVINSLPTIKYVMKNGGIPIMMSHLGRPGGKVDPKQDMKPVAEALESKLGVKVTFAQDCIGKEVEKLLEKAKPGDAFLLQNLRFNPGEKANDHKFVESLAKLGDVYINDAFGTAHREHASVYGVPLLFKKQNKPVTAGLLMQKEIEIWSSVMENKGPKYLCLGGAKLKEKIKALEKLSKEFDKVYIGGLVYNVVRAAQGRSIGISKVTEKDNKDYITETKDCLPKLANLVMPDYLMTAKPSRDGFTDAKKITESEEVPKGYATVDCIYEGKKLETLKKANVAVGFGPFGVFEEKKGGFSEGTSNISQAFSSINIAILGGGDSGKAYKGTKAQFSTGGGASITYLSKKKLPAVEALK